MIWLDRINAWLLAVLLVIAPVAADASQNALSSPSTGTVSGLQLTNNYNNAIDSLNTANSGASAPVNQLSGVPSLGNWWLNTTAAPYGLGMYDGAQWPVLANIDPTAHAWNVQIGGGAATLASASTVDLCATPRNYLTISGTTSITSFGSSCPAGVVKLVSFSASLTLTYNGTSLLIPGSANVQTSAGDQATLVSNGGGNWQIASYTPASGQALINPAIDVGSYVLTSAVSVPSSKYLLAYGQAISRTTYATYLASVTFTQSVTATSGSPTLTGFSDTTQLAPGMAVEATFLPNGTVIAPAGCTSSTCTLNNNASASSTGNVTIFPYGNGCGFGTSCASPSTVFNMPNCADVALVGRGNMGGTPRSDSYALSSTYFGASPNALGSFGGSQTTSIAQANLPSVSFTNSGITLTNGTLTANGNPYNTTCNYNTGGCTGGAQNSFMTTGTGNTSIGSPSSNVSVSAQGSSASGGSGTPISRVQPSLTANCMVRVLTMRATAPHFAAVNDNDLPVAILRRRA